ncbi:MAG: SDR family oxidoreductase [Candidatus Krumholzibacteriota bacterium]|nr:SDR family oxidoreductase [Candidatus Krumholzibacteriota bacterium]
MDLGLENKVAWISGASKGIGLAVARELAREGARVALGARGAEALAQAAARIGEETGRRAFAHALDMADAGAIAAWTAACREGVGDADILVVNAGGPPAGPHDEHGAAAWRAAADLLLHGAVALAEAALPAMKASRWGRVIFMTSVAVKQPIDGLVLSNSLRAAVQGYARSLANELGAAGVTVNCVAPGWTRTERVAELSEARAAATGRAVADIEEEWIRAIPLGRLASPREIAAVVAFLAGERASYVTGQMIAVDGGHARSLF